MYVLIAVALFAALSFTVGRMIREGGNTDISDEVSNLTSSELIQFGTAVKNAVRNAQIDGCADTDISFESVLNSGYTNTNNPPDECRIFDPDGQNISWQEPSPKANDGSTWIFMGNTENEDVGSAGDPELAMFLPRVNRAICRRINESNGLSEGPLEGLNSLTIDEFTGSYSVDNSLGITTAEHGGERSFCFEEGSTGDFYYINILISR